MIACSQNLQIFMQIGVNRHEVLKSSSRKYKKKTRPSQHAIKILRTKPHHRNKNDCFALLCIWNKFVLKCIWISISCKASTKWKQRISSWNSYLHFSFCSIAFLWWFERVCCGFENNMEGPDIRGKRNAFLL